MEKICPVCHKVFEVTGNNHVYCSVRCRKQHYSKVYYEAKPKEAAEKAGGEEIRRFRCCKCHKLVIVTDKKDKRRKFCSPVCEKRYWRHPNKKK